MLKINKKLLIITFALLLTFTFTLTNIGVAQEYEGVEIDALVTPWSDIPQEMLDEFKEDTGITVNIQTMAWDDIHDKIVTSSVAGMAPADVTEFDWSWVGQFGSAGWYEPLDKYFSEEFFEDISTSSIFEYDGKTLGVPYFNDFRVTYINTSHFEEAGIENYMNSSDELIEQAIKIKKETDIEYPLAIPLSATEGSATPWYLMTKALGGELFDENWEPLFGDKNSAGYQAMELLINSLQKYKIVAPASTQYKDVDIIEAFKSGETSIDLAGWAGNMAVYSNEAESNVAGNVKMIPVPGKKNDSTTFGLVEGYGIPKASDNKEAAAEFIKFLNEPENAKKLYKELGLFPNSKKVINELNNEGKLPGGETILEVMKTIEPLFLQGTPPWYPEFSTIVATTINQMAKDSISLEEGMDKLVKESQRLTE
ncbi:ABC transporter substrate-binding protein [Halanaerobium congolense]|uniref:ABC transporter substrate-binding protein n=1 Tax=Halanaerobium congolense TaxID=54121 RepID=UPI00088BFDCE|nr:sugar ABC transporter substrate-binding protein [Halanaerobium congolense]SDK67096.1 carbohydrate ABC transporter substrate-binding protein, CUT1 family [Halanaerobium congolense]SDM34182.1 carbohydrate ABC transporter substrate-binding protein, CUT1 family [Halanaerobium congolense]